MATVYTQVGEEVVVDLIDGTSTSALGTGNARIAWGTGAGTADKADTTLFAESTEGGGEARQTPTVSQPLADKNQWIATLTAESTKTVTNAGVFSFPDRVLSGLKEFFRAISCTVGTIAS